MLILMLFPCLVNFMLSMSVFYLKQVGRIRGAVGARLPGNYSGKTAMPGNFNVETVKKKKPRRKYLNKARKSLNHQG